MTATTHTQNTEPAGDCWVRGRPSQHTNPVVYPYGCVSLVACQGQLREPLPRSRLPSSSHGLLRTKTCSRSVGGWYWRQLCPAFTPCPAFCVCNGKPSPGPPPACRRPCASRLLFGWLSGTGPCELGSTRANNPAPTLVSNHVQDGGSLVLERIRASAPSPIHSATLLLSKAVQCQPPPRLTVRWLCPYPA